MDITVMSPIRLTILSSALFGAAVHSLAYRGPRPTYEVVVPLDAQSPKPTAPPPVHEVLRRQNLLSSLMTPQTVIGAPDNTCGYLNGRIGLLLKSPTGRGLDRVIQLVLTSVLKAFLCLATLLIHVTSFHPLRQWI